MYIQIIISCHQRVRVNLLRSDIIKDIHSSPIKYGQLSRSPRSLARKPTEEEKSRLIKTIIAILFPQKYEKTRLNSYHGSVFPAIKLPEGGGVREAAIGTPPTNCCFRPA